METFVWILAGSSLGGILALVFAGIAAAACLLVGDKLQRWGM